MIKRAVIGVLRFYQRRISPHLGSNCRFTPTCSQYTLEAVEQRGVVVGLLLGFYRILRCNPLCKGGYDPVPQRPKRLK